MNFTVVLEVKSLKVFPNVVNHEKAFQSKYSVVPGLSCLFLLNIHLESSSSFRCSLVSSTYYWMDL